MDALIYGLLVAALAIGYILGRRPFNLRKQDKRFNNAVEQRYIEGLNQLLNEQPDAAIDTLIADLGVNHNTIETHFALGSLWRRRGEVERAIRIHQNLMARPSLAAEHLEKAQLELGLDYLHSGLLDRAEALFRQLSSSSHIDLKTSALQQLTKIYEQELEWNQAIETAEALCHKKLKADVSHWRHMQAHYCCEMAEPLRHARSFDKAREWLTLAHAYDRQHPRVSLLLAEMDLAAGRPTQALRFLRHLDGHEAYLIEVVPLVLEGYAQLESEVGAQEYLAELYQNKRFPGLLPYMAERVHREEGDAEAVNFVMQELQTHPQHASMAQLLKAIGSSTVSFQSIQPVLSERLSFHYRCRSCGFEGTHLYWCCPSCKTWI